MANKMLIDATHPEETRVVVLRGSRVEEFDFESASKRQLRGNIYLAKVIRVEPSLQAAFVDYGGNRHGFLAFSEIHPDYYQIPVSDRQALLEEEAREEHDEEDEHRPRRSRRRRGDRNQVMAHRSHDEVVNERLGPTDGDGAQATSEEGAPAEREADPTYDDPTGDLLRHAGELHEAEPASAEIASAELDAPPAEAQDAGAAGTETDAIGTAPAEAPELSGEPMSVPAIETTSVGDVASQPGDANAATDTPAAPAVTSDADVDTGSTTEPSQSDAGLADDPSLVIAAEHGPSQAKHHHEAEHHQEPSHQEPSHQEPDHQGPDHPEADHHEEEEHVDQIGGDAMEEIPHRAYRPRRQYKIQEVIKRRQVLLVQVVKEERGNKGAALTTYLSLAGRYSVLMPNTARGGGISRKITDATDRQRLKSIAQDLDVPEGMGVILRTAGASRTKPEVKRDFEYLMRMWETVRETTLASTAPTLVYEEGSLIKRAIRDLYNKEVEEVVVSGEGGYREAKDFMRLLMPSHAKNVQLWRDPAPLFTKAGAEAQLDAMFSSHVTLKSGGYLVINQTEALVAIDVNSGRSTREHNIEDTALRTNLEAADEVARQLRLRDLAGLIVVDFIDMEETRNNRAVERRLKDALKDDRARIQVGRISHFGLLEMSRQRIRTGVLEGSTEVCPHCAGAGSVRSTASIALHVLRVLEDALLADASRNLIVRTRAIVALYILNQKRAHVSELEARFGAAVAFDSDETLTATTYCGLERGEPASGIITAPQRPAVMVEEPEIDIVEAVEADGESEPAGGEPSSEDAPANRRRRRRRGRGRDREASGIREDAPQPADDALAMLGETAAVSSDTPSEPDSLEQPETDEEQNATDEYGATEEGRGRRRRSRRGGRRTRDARARQTETDGVEYAEELGGTDLVAVVEETATVDVHLVGAEAGLNEGMPAVTDTAETALDNHLAPEPRDAAPVPAPSQDMPAPSQETPAPTVSAHPEPVSAGDGESAEASERPRRPEPVSSELDPSRPKRSGWWQRAKATLTG